MESAAEHAASPRRPRLATSAALVAALFAVDKVLALVRQLLIARVFGLSAEMDAFNAANNLPDMLFALLSGGALAMAFIPVLSEYRVRHGRVAFWDLFARVANLVFVTTAALSLLLALAASWLIRTVIAPGFSPAQQRLAVALMRLDLLGTLIFSLSGLVSAALYANQHFLLPALAPSLYNLGQIFGAAVLAPQTLVLGPLRWSGAGLGIFGLVYGVLLGALLHLGVQLPGLVRYGFRWWPRLGLFHPGVMKVLALMGPRVLSMFFIQLIFIARDYLASHLPTGAVSALAYGWFIMQVPETLIGTALGIVLLPTLSEHAAAGRWDAWREAFNRAYRALLALTLPVAAALAAALPALIPLLGFDDQGTRLVVWTARAYLVGLTGHALLELVARSFYARQDALTPLLASAFNTAVYLTLAVFFGARLGAPGIGLANALAFTTEALLLLALLRWRVAGVPRDEGALWRAGVAATLALACSGGLLLLWPPQPGLLGPLQGAVAALCGLLPLALARRDILPLLRLARAS